MTDNVNTRGRAIINFDVNLLKYENPEIIHKLSETPKNKERNYCGENVPVLDSGVDIEKGPWKIVEDLSPENVLELILPLREWKQDGALWRQKISNRPVTKSEFQQFCTKLDTYLNLYKASDLGICPIRRELYNQCFNEIIRQTTLNCTEQGYVLIQLRNEIDMTINAYKKLYESTIAYGIRRKLLKKEKLIDLEKMAETIRMETEQLKSERQDVIAAHRQYERETVEARELEYKNYVEELKALKHENQQLKDKLGTLIEPKKQPS